VPKPITRYVAFLSYSHRNRAETEWIHRELERYHIPKKLVGKETAKGSVPARLIPIFRDRDELSASADLGNELKAALAKDGVAVAVSTLHRFFVRRGFTRKKRLPTPLSKSAPTS